MYESKIEFFDDGPEKPVRIWSRIGRRPLVAGGNSNGDIPMLRFARSQSRDGLRLIVLHDDAEREFDYRAGAEDALQQAADRSWTVVSIATDWTTVFPQFPGVPRTRPRGRRGGGLRRTPGRRVSRPARSASHRRVTASGSAACF